CGVDRDRRSEALADDADATRVDVGAARKVRQGVPRVPDLLLADDAAAVSFALAAAAKIEAQRRVAEAGEHRRDRLAAGAVLVAAEPVQDEERRVRCAVRLRQMENAREPELVGHEADAFFHPSLLLEGTAIRRTNYNRRKRNRMGQHHAIDVHSHYFPQSFLDLIEKHGPAHGFEYKIVEGKGPQFKHGHL